MCEENTSKDSAADICGDGISSSDTMFLTGALIFVSAVFLKHFVKFSNILANVLMIAGVVLEAAGVVELTKENCSKLKAEAFSDENKHEYNNSK